MVRYKRYRGRRRNSINVIRMKFQSFMDINTSTDSMQIITVSAGGKNVLQRLPAQFGAYKYYKLGNVAVKLVPASTLPVDPTGLSYEAGENTVDPRDQLTPGMMRITNGEDIFENISGLSDDEQDQLYNAMMLDPRWFKWMLQSGVKRHATPKFYVVGQLHQDKWPGMWTNYPHMYPGDSEVSANYVNTDAVARFYNGTVAPTTMTQTQFQDASSKYGFFQTGQRGKLGWLPTDGLLSYGGNDFPTVTSPPEIELFKIILPRARKTEYYYRMFITETVYFKEPIVQAVGITDMLYRPLDVFHIASKPTPMMPTKANTSSNVNDQQTGGNYGDD